MSNTMMVASLPWVAVIWASLYWGWRCAGRLSAMLQDLRINSSAKEILRYEAMGIGLPRREHRSLRWAQLQAGVD